MEESLQEVVVQEVQNNKRNWERILLYGVCFLLLLSSLKGCFDTSKLEGKMEEQKKEIKALTKVYKEEKTKFLSFQDSIRKDTEAKNDSIRILKEEREKLKKENKSLEEKNKKQKQEIKNWNNSHFTSFFKEYYKTENIVETPNGVELQKETPSLVAETIFDKELFKDQLANAREEIENLGSEIKLEQGKTLNAEIERDKTKSLLDKSEELGLKKDDLLENANKTINRLNVKNVFNKVALPVGIGVGILTGILIAK